MLAVIRSSGGGASLRRPGPGGLVRACRCRAALRYHLPEMLHARDARDAGAGISRLRPGRAVGICRRRRRRGRRATSGSKRRLFVLRLLGGQLSAVINQPGSPPAATPPPGPPGPCWPDTSRLRRTRRTPGSSTCPRQGQVNAAPQPAGTRLLHTTAAQLVGRQDSQRQDSCRRLMHLTAATRT